MTQRQRLALFFIFLGVLVFIGLLFTPFVSAYILTPLAMAGWFFMRIYILSVHQQVYWWIFISIALYWVGRRLVGSRPAAPPPLLTTPNDTLQAVEKWRSTIFVSTSYPEMRHQLKLDLIQMLITLFSSRQQSVTYAEVFEPLKQRQIPLPDAVYDFLFAPEPVKPRLTLAQKLRALPRTLPRALAEAPRRWWRRWSGQETAEFYQSVEAVLAFIESTLEIPYDDQPTERSNH